MRSAIQKYYVEPRAATATALPLAAIYVLREARPPFAPGIARPNIVDAGLMVRNNAYRPAMVRRMAQMDLYFQAAATIAQRAGIFTLTGRAAASYAGPSIALSFVLAAVCCGLAALCYAELAAAVPTAGSSYTYAYTTIGEVFAWIIGWDLILEFALGSATVAPSSARPVFQAASTESMK